MIDSNFVNSWNWACMQMRMGRVVKPRSAPGSVVYKIDSLSNERIVWTFAYHIDKSTKWESANIFLSDFRCKWELVKRVTCKLKRKSN